MTGDFPFLTTLFALLAAAAWGSGDFTGGLSARRVGSFLTVLISYSVSMVVLVIAAVITREPIPQTSGFVWGAAAGLSGMAGLGFLLRGFAVGRMGVVAPISASLAAIIPVIFTAFTVGLPSPMQLFGFGLALAGVWLLSRPESIGDRPAGIGFAVLAGLGFGGFFTALDQVGDDAVFWPLVAGRAACFAVLAGYAIAARKPLTVRRSLLGLIALAGVLDVSGNFFFLIAIQTGRLDVATVLGSLYPAVTTLLAWLIAHEKIERHQLAGVAAAILAIILITV